MKPRPNHSPFHTRNRNRIAILVGWPELGDVTDPGTPSGPGLYREVRVISMNNTASWSADPVSLTRQCSDLGPGWVEIYRFSACESSAAQSAHVRDVPEQLPDFSVGRLGVAVGLAELGTYMNLGTQKQETRVETCPCPVKGDAAKTLCSPYVEEGNSPNKTSNPCPKGNYYNYTITATATLGGTGEITREICETGHYNWSGSHTSGYRWQQGISAVGRAGSTQRIYYFDIKAICALPQ